METPLDIPITGFDAAPHGSAWRVYRRLCGYAWRYKGRLIVSICFALLIAASLASMLMLLGTAVDLTFYAPAAPGEKMKADPADKIVNGVHEKMDAWVGGHPASFEPKFRTMVASMRADKMRALWMVCVLVMGLAVVIAGARFLQEYFGGAVGANITTDLSKEMYANLMRQSVGFFEARSSGEILSRFTNDIFMVDKGLSGVFVKLMREPILALTFAGVAVSVDPWLALVGLGVLPPVFYALARIGSKMRKSVRRSLQKVASMASVVNETVVGITIVKSYTMEEYESSRVGAEIQKLRKFLYRMVKLHALTGPITELLLVMGIVAFVLFSGYRLVSGALEPGGLAKLCLAVAMVLDPVRKLSIVNNLIQTSVASAERVFEFIDARSPIVEAPDAKDIPPLQESLRFENVHFAYNEDAEVLHGIDLEVKKGEMVALVGFSGGGKSTLVKLIPRFYDVSVGAIKIDGVDIRKATLKSLCGQISFVTQDTILFAESIRANIAYGRGDYTDERVRAAAQAANATDFIETLPAKYDTLMGESGGTLSGGQRQRLAIARAIIKDPAILILDEATSSLDSESERLIQDALGRFVQGRTTLVIAHRLSTVQRAGRIVVLDQGRIAEQGTHEELLRHGGIYKRLYDTQFGIQE